MRYSLSFSLKGFERPHAMFSDSPINLMRSNLNVFAICTEVVCGLLVIQQHRDLRLNLRPPHKSGWFSGKEVRGNKTQLWTLDCWRQFEKHYHLIWRLNETEYKYYQI